MHYSGVIGSQEFGLSKVHCCSASACRLWCRSMLMDEISYRQQLLFSALSTSRVGCGSPTYPGLDSFSRAAFSQKYQIARYAHMLILGRDSYSSNARDKVFAMIALSSIQIIRPEDVPFQVNCNLAVEHLFIQFSISCVEKNGGLAILSAVENYNRRLNINLPSQVPD